MGKKKQSCMDSVISILESSLIGQLILLALFLALVVPFLLFYCIYACATGGNPELLSDEELAEAQAKRKILEAAQAAIASEPGVPDSADDIVELSLALPLEGPPADGLLGINSR